MSNKSIRMVIDGQKCAKSGMDTEVSQVSPVSSILFAIYVSGVFKEMETEIEGCMAISFADNYGWLVTEETVEQIY